MNSGASRKPPLLPSRPETKPTTPTTTRIRVSVARVRVLARAVGAPCVRRMRKPNASTTMSVAMIKRAAGYPSGQQRAEHGRRETDRQSELHDACIDVAAARVRRDSRTTIDGIVAGSGDAIATSAGTPSRCSSGVAIAEPPLPNAPDKKPTPTPISIAPSKHVCGHSPIQRRGTHRSRLLNLSVS